MVRSIVLVGGQEAPLTKEAIAMKYTRQLKAKGSLERYNSLVEGFSSESNLSTFDFTTSANLSIDFSPRDNLTYEYSNSEDGDLVESPLLAVIEAFILGQRKNTATSLVSDTYDNDEETDSSVSSCDSENGVSFSQSGANRSKKSGKASATKVDEIHATNQYVVHDSDKSPSNASRQRLKRWRQLLQQKIRKASGNSCLGKDEAPMFKTQSMVPMTRAAALVDEPKNTELGMISSESMEESTILMISRNSTLSTFQSRRGPINSCLPFDVMLRCGQHRVQHSKQDFGSDHQENFELSPVAAKIEKGASRSRMAKSEQSEAQTTFSVPLTRALSIESIEETEIVFCDSDDFSVGNDETLWDNPRLWERWAPTETPVVTDETLAAASLPTRRARSLQNPIVEKMPHHEFYKSRTSDEKVCSQPTMKGLTDDDLKAQFSLLRDEGVEIVQSDVPKVSEQLVAKSKRPKSPRERKMSPLLAHLRSPRYAGLPPLAPRSASKATEEKSNQNIPTVERNGTYSAKRHTPILCSHCRHELHTHGQTTLPLNADGLIGATLCRSDKPDEQTVHAATSATVSINPTSLVTSSVDKAGSQQPAIIGILDETEPKLNADNIDVITSSLIPEKTSGCETSEPLAQTAANLVRPPVRLSVETSQQIQATLEGTTRSSKPWIASAKFQEVAPKIDFRDGADEIELVREAPVRLHNNVFWHTKRFRSSTPKKGNGTKNPGDLLKSSSLSKAIHSGGESITDATHNPSDETIERRASLPLSRFKSLFSMCQATKNDEHEMRAPKSESVVASLRRRVTRQKGPNGTQTNFPSPISVIAPISPIIKHSSTHNPLEVSGTGVVPIPTTHNGEFPEHATPANNCHDIEPCQTYDEALALEQAKKQVHIENCRFAMADHHTENRESNLIKVEDLRGDRSVDAKKKGSTGVPASYPFKAADNNVLRPPVSPTVGSDDPATLKDVEGEKNKTPAKQMSTLNVYPALIEQQCHSDSSNSSLKKVLRRVAKHRVAFKEDIDGSVHTAFTSRLAPEGEYEDVALEMNASDIVLHHLAMPNAEERKSETKTVQPRRPHTVKRKAKIKANDNVSIGGESNARHSRKEDTHHKPESKVIFGKCSIVRELSLSPSDTTHTSVRVAAPVKKIRSKRRHTVVDPSDVEAVKRRSDETVATGGTKTSAVSGLSRLTAAERKLARRLASDINILAKIEKKRRAMGQPGSKTKTEGIEKSLKLLQSINASRQERKTKEGTEESQERDDKETTAKEQTFGGFFGTFVVFGK